MTTIENSVKGASGLTGVIGAVSSATVTLATMGTQVKTTFGGPPGTRRKGRPEKRIREFERLQFPDQ